MNFLCSETNENNIFRPAAVLIVLREGWVRTKGPYTNYVDRRGGGDSTVYVGEGEIFEIFCPYFIQLY